MHYFEPIPLGEPTGINPPLGHVYVYFDSTGKQHTKMSDGSSRSGVYTSGSVTSNVYTKFDSGGNVTDGLLSDDGADLNTTVNLILTGGGAQDIYASDGNYRYGLEIDQFAETVILRIVDTVSFLPYFGGFYATTGEVASMVSYSSTGLSQFTISPSLFEISSNIVGFTGLSYASDYSGDYTNRSLVDKEYVDTKVTSIAGGTLDYLAKFDGSGGLVDSVIFDDGTDIGIGTNTPGTKLHVFVTGANGVRISTSTYDFNLIPSGGSSLTELNTTNIGYQFTSTDGYFRFQKTGVAGKALIYGNSGIDGIQIGDGSGNPIATALYSNNSFGVGTIAPTATLHTKGSTNDNTAFAFKVDNSNNTNFFNVRNDGAINIFGGNGTDSTVAIRQRDFAYTTIVDIYNNSFSKLCFRATDNGSAGQIIIGHNVMTVDNYTNNVAISAGALIITGNALLSDVFAARPFGGSGGVYIRNDINNDPLIYLQNAAGTSTQVVIGSGGTSYINGGDLVIGDITAGARLNTKGVDTTSSNNAFLAESSTALIYTIRNDHTLIYQGISSGYTGSEEYTKQAGVQTTDATVTNIATVVTSDGQMTVIKGTVSGYRSDFTEAYGATFFAVFYTNGGVITQVGTTDVVEKFNFSGTPTIVVDGDSGSIRIRVTGEAAKTINWTTTYKYQKTLTNS